MSRANAMGKVIMTEGTPMAGAGARYQWFYDNDVYTYNLLNSMYYIGVQSDLDENYMGGEVYLTLANQYLHASNKGSALWQAPAVLADRPYLGGVGEPNLDLGQMIVDSSAADIAAEEARLELSRAQAARQKVLEGYERLLAEGVSISEVGLDDFNSSDFTSTVCPSCLYTGTRSIEKPDTNGDPLHVGHL